MVRTSKAELTNLARGTWFSHRKAPKAVPMMTSFEISHTEL